MNAETNGRLYGYARVSSRPQVDGDSLDTQARLIEGRAVQEALPVCRLYIEKGVPGSVPFAERPEGKALLSVLKPGDVLVVTKLDRAWRDAADSLKTLAWCKTKKIRLILIDIGEVTADGGVGSLLFGVLASVAQWEKDRIGSRVAECKAHAKEQNRFLGGRRPFGFQIGKDKELIPDPNEQVALALILKQAGEGRSLRAIQASVSDACGLKLSHTAVARCLRDARVSSSA